MTDADLVIAAADAKAAHSRSAFLSTLALAKQRLKPGNLKNEAKNAVLDATLDGLEDAKQIAREHPVKVIGFAAALVAIAARRPLWALSRNLWEKSRDAYRQHVNRNAAEDHHAEE